MHIETSRSYLLYRTREQERRIKKLESDVAKLKGRFAESEDARRTAQMRCQKLFGRLQQSMKYKTFFSEMAELLKGVEDDS